MADVFRVSVQLLAQLLTILVIVDILLSYVLSPYHSVRMTLDRLVEPLLAPIRRVVPPVQMLDFSPIILILLIQVIERFLISIISTLR